MNNKTTLSATSKAVFGALTFAIIAFTSACTGSTAKEKPKYSFKDGTGPNGAVAIIDGKAITEEALIGDEKIEYLDLASKLHEFKVYRLGITLLNQVYEPEAKKANMSLQEYLEKKVFEKDLKISDSEYNKFVAERKIPKEKIDAELKENINRYMKGQKMQELTQKLITKVSKEHKVEAFFQKPSMKVLKSETHLLLEAKMQKLKL